MFFVFCGNIKAITILILTQGKSGKYSKHYVANSLTLLLLYVNNGGINKRIEDKDGGIEQISFQAIDLKLNINNFKV